MLTTPPKGAYMSGTTLKQADLRKLICYKCKRTKHFKKYCPLNKRGGGSKGGGGKSAGAGKGSKPSNGKPEKKKNGTIGIRTT